MLLLAASQNNANVNTLLDWIGLASFVLVGIFAVIGIFDKVSKGRKKEAGELDDRLINLLKEEVASLHRTQEEQTNKQAITQAQVTGLNDELILLRHENDVLRGLIKGSLLEAAFKQLDTKVSKKTK